MAFDSLSEKLQNIFKNLRGKGRLSEADVKAALKEVKLALLEADVNFKVVKQIIKSVEERAIGQDVMSSLTPGQMVIKIVNEEMVSLMGSETTEIALKPGSEITVIMMAGLQGAGLYTSQATKRGFLPFALNLRGIPYAFIQNRYDIFSLLLEIDFIGSGNTCRLKIII